MEKRVNYLNNKDLLKEIHKSKLSYCEFVDAKYKDYDLILNSKEECSLEENINTARQNKADKYAKALYEAQGENKVNKLAFYNICPSKIPLEDLVFRVMTYEHIPLANGRKKNPKRTADYHARVYFPPFKHYAYINDTLSEVGISHWHKGEFNQTHGKYTPQFSSMLLMLVNRFSQKGNWFGYSYLEEMKGQALIQLSTSALMFNEAKSDNPFAYLTQLVDNSFKKVWTIEKEQQNIKDKYLVSMGYNPSFSKQMAHEEEVRKLREEANQNIEDI